MSDVPTLPRPLPVPPLVLAMIGVMMGCVLDALIKHLGAAYTAVLIAEMRYLFGMVFSGAAVLAFKRRLPNGAGLRRHAIRTVAVTGSAVLFFHSLAILPITEATVLMFCAPLMIAPLAWWILGEKMQPIAAIALAIGFVGVIVTVQGAPEAADTARRMEGVISGFAASVLYALSIVLLRQVAQRDDAIVTAFLGNLFPALYLAPFALLLGAAPAMTDLPVFGFAGLTGFLLWFLLTQAYARAPAQSLAIAEYTALIWSALLGYFFFSEIPRWQVWIGALVIVFAVMLSAWHSRRTRIIPAAD